MKIKINDEEKNYNLKKGEYLFDIVESLKSELESEHQVITEILLNEKSIALDDESIKTIKITPSDNIQINTTHIRDLTIQNIIDSLHLLPKIKEDFKSVLLYIRKGDRNKMIEILLSCLAGLRWFNLTLNSTEKVLGMDLSSIKSDGVSLLDETYKLIDILKQLLFAMESSDSIRISDTIEYELIPIIDEFIKIMPELIKELDKRIIH